MNRADPRTWIWIFVVVQVAGLAFDALWHGVLRREFEGESFGEMARHLMTVHLPLYIGVLGLLVSAAWALVARVKRSKAGIALPLAVAGAIVQTIGEAWHAYAHLELRPNPLPELLGFIGLLVVIAAMLVSRRAEHPRSATAPAPDAERRRYEKSRS